MRIRRLARVREPRIDSFDGDAQRLRRDLLQHPVTALPDVHRAQQQQRPTVRADLHRSLCRLLPRLIDRGRHPAAPLDRPDLVRIRSPHPRLPTEFRRPFLETLPQPV